MIDNYSLLQEPAGNGVPTVAVDLEGTLTAGASWRGMHRYLIDQGREREAKRFLYRHIPDYYLHKIAGWAVQEAKNRWIRDLLQLFRGFSEAEFRTMTEWAVENELWPQRRVFVLDEMERHRADGRRVIVVTGIFEPYVGTFIERVPGLEAIGTTLVFEDGRVNGELASPFTVDERKAELLEPFTREGKIYSAYGDSWADRHMLAMSERPVAVHPDKRLRRLAESEGWRILEE
jgi:phosphoserine phosphatase